MVALLAQDCDRRVISTARSDRFQKNSCFQMPCYQAKKAFRKQRWASALTQKHLIFTIKPYLQPALQVIHSLKE
ncbi:MAG: hypothetical protein K2Q97_08695 [Burkholderiaceae bacterium]|nr:hypothetical protein [Burkholderiaceae bacterium]